jgi:hypothetical protein
LKERRAGVEHPSFSLFASVHTFRFRFLTEGNGGNEGGLTLLIQLRICFFFEGEKGWLEYPSFSLFASVHTLRFRFLTEGNGGNEGSLTLLI